MANINWWTTFQVSFVVPFPEPIPPLLVSFDFPTYGLNGGANYTGGTFDPSQTILTGDPVGLDALDLVFFEHDVNSASAATPAQQAAADYELLQDIVEFNRHDLHDPEACLYAGAVELAMIASLAINPQGVDLTPKELAVATRDAAQNIKWGLKHLDGDELALVEDVFADLSASFETVGGLGDALDILGVDLPKLNPHVAEFLL